MRDARAPPSTHGMAILLGPAGKNRFGKLPSDGWSQPEANCLRRHHTLSTLVIEERTIEWGLPRKPSLVHRNELFQR